MGAPDAPICDYEGSDYQTSFWERGGREYEDRVEAIALRRLLPARGGLLLELGAGAGRNTSRYGAFQRIVLLDYSRSQLEQAQSRLGRSDRYIYVAADIYRLPFLDGIFDAATMIRVLHHMTNAQGALRGVRDALEPQGVFILEYANKRNLKSILRFWLGKQKWSPFDLEPVEFARLNFDFHPHRVEEWLRALNLNIERRLTVSHFRAPALKKVVPLGLLVALDSFLQFTGELWQLTPSVFLRARKDPGPAASVPTSLGAASLFKCPDCGGTPLAAADEALTCPVCAKNWSFREGIYDFRAPLAEDAAAGTKDPPAPL